LRRSPLPRANLHQLVHPQLPLFQPPNAKKLPLKKAKRKAPRVVSDEETDEATEDGLICKRKRVAVTEPPAIESAAPNFIENPPSASTPFESGGDVLVSNASVAEAALEQLADTQASSQAAENLPASTPRLEAPPPSNLVRVVVSTNRRLLQQPQTSQPLFKKL